MSMKKNLILALITTVLSATFVTEVSAMSRDTPEIILSVFDKRQNPSPDLHKKEISRSNKNELVCWVATGIFDEQEIVTETLEAEGIHELSTDDLKNAKLVSSPDEKVNSVTYTNPRKTPNTMSNCWEFEPQDPIGKYVLTVKIGEKELEKQVFYVGK